MRTRITLLLSVLVLLLAVSEAEAALPACSITDAGYKQRFDGVRGQAVDGNVRYSEKRIYLEFQTWLTPVGQEPGHHSEHVHVGACVPQGETWVSPNGDRYIDHVFIFHNVAGYRATAIAGSFVTASGSSAMFEPVTQAQLDTLTAAMNASGNGATTRVYLSLKMRSQPTNGRKEARWGLHVARSGPAALVETWKLDARWYSFDAYAGLPTVSPISDHVSYVRSRTVVEFFRDGLLKLDYHHSGWCNPPASEGSWEWTRDFIIRPRASAEDVCVRVTDGGGPAALEIDPNHHVHPDNRGKWFTDFDQFVSGNTDPDQLKTISVPFGSLALASGLHRLAFLSHDEPECARLGNPCPTDVRPVWTNVAVLPFKVS